MAGASGMDRPVSGSSDDGAHPAYRLLMVLFIFVGMAEGFDVQAMALAAPLVSVAWSLDAQVMGMLLAVSVIGMVCGSFALSPLGDRMGRRPTILIALAVSAVATASGAYVPDIQAMAVVRFLAGLGLGMALPNVIALASELVPTRIRILAVVLVSAGYPMGAAIGGAISGRLIPSLGYAAVFLLGGVMTSLATLLCLFCAPESPKFAARRRALADSVLTKSAVAGQPTFRENFGQLFTPVRRRATLLLWLVNFANTAMVYFYFNWLPSLLVHRGAEVADAVFATAIFSGSGVVGGLLMAFALPKVGPRIVLGTGYAIAVVSAVSMAWISGMGWVFFLALIISGAVVIGSQFCLTAVVNEFYPATIRTTATGYASGMGRLGAVAAPIAGGMALGLVASPGQALIIAAFPAALALIGIIMLGKAVTLDLQG